MTSTLHHDITLDPRWGERDRDRKGEAILRTLQDCCGPQLSMDTWLDIGCGSGGIAATLAPHVKQMFGIDPEPWQRWQVMCGRHPNLKFKAASWRQLPEWLGNDAVDVVVCNQVYEHVDSAPELIAAIGRVLKSGGVCYFAGPNLLWPIEPHVFWPFVHWMPRKFARSLMKTLGSKQAEDFDAFSAHYWRLKFWFRDAGLKSSAALFARLNAGIAMKNGRQIPRWFASALDALMPVSPGFVFCLRKP